jgi:DNA-binding MarR family transcriptional regulator
MIEVMPLGTRWLRAAVRRQNPSWSVPQLVTLGYLRDHPGSSLSEVAAQLGIGLPAASTLVSRLVDSGQLDRREDPTERRRTVLTLTRRGKAQLEAAIQASGQELAVRLRSLPARDLDRIGQAMAVLRTLFDDARPASAGLLLGAGFAGAGRVR